MRRWLGAGAAVVAVATLGVAVGPARSACACSCAVVTRDEQVGRADLVFVGEAASEVVAREPRTVFAVESVVKGSATGKVTVYSVSSDEASCGIRFTVGARYEVFARRDGDRLTTNLCAGNRVLDRNDRRTAQAPSGQSLRPADSVRDFGPAAPWSALAGWGAAALGVLAVVGLWLRSRGRRPSGGAKSGLDGQKPDGPKPDGPKPDDRKPDGQKSA